MNMTMHTELIPVRRVVIIDLNAPDSNLEMVSRTILGAESILNANVDSLTKSNEGNATVTVSVYFENGEIFEHGFDLGPNPMMIDLVTYLIIAMDEQAEARDYEGLIGVHYLMNYIDHYWEGIKSGDRYGF